jgi:hypothetical protein
MEEIILHSAGPVAGFAGSYAPGRYLADREKRVLIPINEQPTEENTAAPTADEIEEI